MNWREGYASGNGLRLHYVEWGARSAPAVLLLHGLGGHGLAWEPVARRLATRFRCIAPDARGHGASDWAGAGGYVSDAHFADLPPLLDALGIERAAVCGFSMGAAAAIQFAAALPERCSALAVIDSYPDPEPSPGSTWIAQYCAGLPDEFDSPEAALYHLGLPTDGAARSRMADLAVRTLDDGRYTWGFDPAIRDELRAALLDGGELRRIDLWPFWRALDVPTLLVRGASSTVLTRAMAERMVAELPAARLVELPAGHTIVTEQPEALAEHLAALLASVGKGTC